MRRIHKPRQDSPDSVIAFCCRMTQRGEQKTLSFDKRSKCDPLPVFTKQLCDIVHTELQSCSSKVTLGDEGRTEKQGRE